MRTAVPVGGGRSPLSLDGQMKDWIFEKNLRPVLEIVSRMVGYQFDQEDWNVVRFGVRDSNSEKNQWYEYPLGESHVTARLRRNAGSAVIDIELEGMREDLLDRIGLVISVAQDYDLVPRH